MTIAEISAQMGVTPETLVQEVIAKHVTGGILLTALYGADAGRDCGYG